MKTFENIAAQGDFLIRRIDESEIPDNAVVFEADVNGAFVVAHSETGHNHVMERTPSIEAFKPADTKDNELYDLFFKVKAPTEIRHLRTHDTHETLRVNPGVYRIHRQREYTAEGFRRAAD